MTVEKKMELLEDLFEVDPGEIKPEMALADVDGWDSMTALSLIVMLDDECGKRVAGDDVKALVTVQDIMDLMG